MSSTTPDMKYKNIIGPVIRRHRNNLGWTQNKLAIRLQIAGLDLDRSRVSKIESQTVRVIDIEQIYFAQVLKISIGDLFSCVPVEIPAHDYISNALVKKKRTRG